MAEKIQIKSEIFHSFFSLLLNHKAIVFNDKDDSYIEKLKILRITVKTPIILECYEPEETYDKLTKIRDISINDALMSAMHYITTKSKPIYICRNYLALNMKKLNDLTKEDVRYILDTLQNYGSHALECFSIASNKNESMTLDSYLEQKAKEKEFMLEHLEERHKTKLNLSKQDLIDEAYYQYKESLDRADRFYKNYQKLLSEQAQLMLKNSSIISDLLDIVRRNKLIKLATMHYNSDQTRICIYTGPLSVEYTCGEETANRIIYNNSSLSNAKIEYKDAIYDALVNRENYVLLHNPLQIVINIDNSDNISQWAISHLALNLSNYSSVYTTDSNYIESNTHYFRYNCLGGFSGDLATSVRNNDIKRLIATLIQYISTINIADVAGVTWATKCNHIVKDLKTGNIYEYYSDGTKEDITEIYNTTLEMYIEEIKAGIDKYIQEGEENTLYVDKI